MAKSLREARWRRKCVGEANPHGNDEVTAWSRMSYGVAKVIAHRCSVSVSRVHNWMCGEQPSPLTQLRRAIDAALDEGQSPENATAPVEYLCDRYLVRVPESKNQPQIRLVHSAGLALERMSEAVQVALSAIADGVIDEAELDDFERLLNAARRQTEVLRMVMRRDAHPDRSTSETVGASEAATS